MINTVHHEVSQQQREDLPDTKPTAAPKIFISRLRIPSYPRDADGASPGFLCLVNPRKPVQPRDAVLVTVDDQIYGFARVIDAGHRSHVKWSETLVGQLVTLDLTVAQKRAPLHGDDQVLLMQELIRVDALLEGGRRYLRSYETPFGAQVSDRALGLRLLKAAYAQATSGAAESK